jgi:predicted transcriptional regulator
MTTLSIRLPDSLHEIARKVAEEDHISLNQFIASAVSEKVAALTAEKYLKARAERGSRQRFEDVLSKVPANEPESFDR